MTIANAEMIERLYAARTKRSAALAAEARTVLPSGIVHDSRRIIPHPLYAGRARGAHKWDVDGNRYIDYFGGHGSLMLGHNPPEIMAAASEQLAKGTHFAACHEAEIRWAEAITAMVPSAEKVRFHASGTEATQMAVRLARAFTGRSKLMRFHGHYHGWQDDMTTGYISQFNGGAVIGVPESVAAETVAVDPYREDAVERRLAEGDVAALILEPLGAATGKVPLTADFLHRLHEWTRQAGTVLIFDEVITGFRVAPGGMQEQTGILPDLTALAKIVAGGMPGGAVCGNAAIMDGLDFDAAAQSGRQKVYHPGTFNAFPVAAAAGTKILDLLRDGEACRKASALAADLRGLLNGVIRAKGVPWHVYGEVSAFHICLSPELTDRPFDPVALGREGLMAQPPDLSRLLRLSMATHGVDLSGWPGGLVSAAHEPADIEATADAFAKTVDLLHPTG